MIQAIGLTGGSREGQRPAVDDLSFEAPAGRITVLLGPEGAGKTTALRLMLQLESGRGVALFRGRPLHRVPNPARELGVLLGDVPGHPARTARGHLRMLSAAAGVPASRADDVLDVVGLSGLADERLGAFSRGMDRRLGLAVALLGDPHTLLLDEPSEGVSPREAAWLHGLLQGYAAQGGTVLLTSRDARSAARLAHRVVTVEDGRLIADQNASDFARTRLRPRVVVRSPHADRLASLLVDESQRARPAAHPNAGHAVEVVRESGSRIAVYGSNCATVGDTAFRHGILVHRLADEVGDTGPVTPLTRADGRARSRTAGSGRPGAPVSVAPASPGPAEGAVHAMAAAVGTEASAEPATCAESIPHAASPSPAEPMPHTDPASYTDSASLTDPASCTEPTLLTDPAPLAATGRLASSAAFTETVVLPEVTNEAASQVTNEAASQVTNAMASQVTDATASHHAFPSPAAAPTSPAHPEPAVASPTSPASTTSTTSATSPTSPTSPDSALAVTPNSPPSPAATSTQRPASTFKPLKPLRTSLPTGSPGPAPVSAESAEAAALKLTALRLSGRGPEWPLRYELRRASTDPTGPIAAVLSLVVTLVFALALARVGDTSRVHVITGWPRQLPFPPTALAAGLIGALSFGQEFRYPALAPAQGTVPRRLGLLGAKLLVSGGAAVLLAIGTLLLDGVLVRGLFGSAGLPQGGDWKVLAVSWTALLVGCAWAGVLAAGVFRSTALGMAAVLAVPVGVLPLVQQALAVPAARSLVGVPARLRSAALIQWPAGLDQAVAAVLRLAAQPVGGAVALSLAVLVCAYALTTLRRGAR
ncbi:ATP-binding cassette domain-containing protein [Streptomyces sp. NPDC007100]|uniref:ABC transporter ATP-binding protein n=1 Tax=Streptomyces sp. NPDC007100 TaxID=3155602 RepID=UPI0033FB65CD